MLTCRAGAISRQYPVATAFSDVCHLAHSQGKKKGALANLYIICWWLCCSCAKTWDSWPKISDMSEIHPSCPVHCRGNWQNRLRMSRAAQISGQKQANVCPAEGKMLILNISIIMCRVTWQYNWLRVHWHAFDQLTAEITMQPVKALGGSPSVWKRM